MPDASSSASVCETVDFHGGRNWIAEVAVWDLARQGRRRAALELLGGRADRLLAYASSGELVAADERVRRCVALRDAGVRRSSSGSTQQDWRDDLTVVEAVRDAVGSDIEIMVDANQGWRMPGDLTPRWDVAPQHRSPGARAVGRLLARGAAPTDDLDGYAALDVGTSMRHRGGRDGPLGSRGTRPRPARRRRRGADRRRALGRVGGCRRVAGMADLAGRPGRRTRGRTDTGCSRTSTPRSHSRRPVRRGAVRPARVVGGAA